MMRVYKVVREDRGRFKSAVMGDTEFAAHYVVGEFTHAPIGGLLCFPTVEEAIAFMGMCEAYNPKHDFAVFSADGEGKVDLPAYAASARVRKLVEDVWNYIYDSHSFQWPPTTIAFERVRLLERIE
jgi:hypothetical protein